MRDYNILMTQPDEAFDPERPEAFEPWNATKPPLEKEEEIQQRAEYDAARSAGRGEMRALTDKEAGGQILKTLPENMREGGWFKNVADIAGGTVLGKRDESDVDIIDALNKGYQKISEYMPNAPIYNWILRKTPEAEDFESEQRKDLQTPNQREIVEAVDYMDNMAAQGVYNPDDPEFIKAHEELLDKYHDEISKQGTPEEVPISWSEILDYAREHPYEMGANMANALMQDPELAATPLGAIKAAKAAGTMVRAAGAGAKAIKTAEIAGGVTGAGALGAGLGAGIEATRQLAEEPELDVAEIGQVAKEWGVGSAAFGGLIKIPALVKLGKWAAEDTAAATKRVTEAYRKAKVIPEKEQVTNMVDVIKSLENIEGKGEVEIAKIIRQVAQKHGVTEQVEQKVIEDILSDVPIRSELTPTEHITEVVKRGFHRKGAAIEDIVMENVGKGEDVQAIVKELSKNKELTSKLVDEEIAMHMERIDAGTPDDVLKLVQKEVATAIREGADLPASAKMNPQMVRAFKQAQAGEIDPRLLIGMGVAGTALAFGETFNEKLGLAMTGLGVTVLGSKALTAIRGGAKEIRKAAAGIDKVSKHMDVAEYSGKAVNRSAWQSMNQIQTRIPKIDRREAIALFLEGTKTVTSKMAKQTGLKAGSIIKLTAEEMKVADQIRKAYDEIYNAGVQAGVLKEGTYLKEYISHFWQKGMKSETEIADLLMGIGKPKTSGKTPHALKRGIVSYSQGVEGGMKPLTMDVAVQLKMYTQAIHKAIANKKLMTNLMATKLADDTPIIGHVGKVPDNYVHMGHPQLQGLKVHPEMVDSLKFFFDSTDPSNIERAALATNFISKRMLVSTSLFHANALIESMSFAQGIFKTITGMAEMARVPLAGKISGAYSPQKMLNMLRKGSAGDLVDSALKHGLEIGKIEDVGTDAFYASLKEVEGMMNRVVPLSGAAVGKVFVPFNKLVDRIMWDNLATGMKLSTYAQKYSDALKNPKYANMTPDEIGNSVATYVNDAFGGLNWRRIAEGVENKFGREAMMRAFHPSGRRKLQLMMFAPDWCVFENTRAMTKTGWKYHYELKVGDEILIHDPKTNTNRWGKIKDKFENDSFNGEMVEIKNANKSILMTPNHTCRVNRKGEDITIKAAEIKDSDRIPRCAPMDLPIKEAVDDKLIRIVGWMVTDGSYCYSSWRKKSDGSKTRYRYGRICQNKESGIEDLDSLGLKYYEESAASSTHGKYRCNRPIRRYYIPSKHIKKMHSLGIKNNNLTWEFISKLSKRQLNLLYKTMMLGDGTGQGRFCGKEEEVFNMTMLQTMLGKPTTFYQQEENCWRTRIIKSTHIWCDKKNILRTHKKGTIWCPSVDTGFWVAENHGMVFITGNTIANARVLFKALPGASKNKLEGNLHKAYAVRSALMFLTIGTAIQSFFQEEYSPIWLNDDPTRVDMGNGQEMGIFKQTAEVAHWLTKPGKTGANKTGIWPKEFYTQAMNIQYMGSYEPIRKAGEPVMEQVGATVKHVGKNLVPIAYSSALDRDGNFSAKKYINGMLGRPIYGEEKGL